MERVCAWSEERRRGRESEGQRGFQKSRQPEYGVIWMGRCGKRGERREANDWVRGVGMWRV